MGKSAWQKWRGSEEYGSSDYWQWQQPKAAKTGQSVLEVKYDQIKLEEVQTQKQTAGVEDKASESGAKSLAQIVQKAVNAARKATSKCKKLEEEIGTRRKKWEAYQLQVKVAFQRQHAQFMEDVSRLEGELDADENLKQVLQGQGRTHPLEHGVLMEGVEPEEDPWEGFVKDALTPAPCDCWPLWG